MNLKVMSFNIQHGRDYIKRIIDLDQIASIIKANEAEVIVLNEVYGSNETFSNQAFEIASKLGYHYYFGKAIDYQGRPYGNALISKFPFNASTIMIPDPIRNTNEMYETRCIMKAENILPNLCLLGVHVGLVKSEQKNAIQTLLNVIKEIKTPVILMGDFNMTPDDETLLPIKNILRDIHEKSLLTYPSVNPIKKIDYIFVSKEIEVVSSEVLPIVASDHFPIVASIILK